MRVILIVLDGVGAGALPDAEQYGDRGANTLRHIFESSGSAFALPNLAQLGLYSILSIPRLAIPTTLTGSFGMMASSSCGKDTMAGHWELSGVVVNKPYPTFPKGFPAPLIAEFERQIGSATLGNCAASGTEIIVRLGEEHCRSGCPIVYTSADSVFQIAAHEESFGLEPLFRICRIAREILTGECGVCRVIARPFTGKPGNFVRTANRKDFPVPPPRATVLDKIKKSGGNVIAVGKIEDIFNLRGISSSMHTRNNGDGMAATLKALSASPGRSLIFTNLGDFDTLWGHRRNCGAFARGLTEFDSFVPALMRAMQEDDLLIITADHGCDPTFTMHTDHTREYVPLLVSGKKIKKGVNLGTRATFSDVGQTIAEVFELDPLDFGTSFKRQLG